MTSDELVWQILDKQFCSFKIETRDSRMCTNPMNVVGICKMTYCPLANSRYATVIESKGKMYLCIKTVERAHLPSKLWEKIVLDTNYEKALAQIDENLPYWDKRAIARCKRRFTRLFLVLKRTRKLRNRVKASMVAVKKKEERMLRSREARALRIAHLDQAIEGELMNRLRSGLYGTLYEKQQQRIKEKQEERRKQKLAQKREELGEDVDEDDLSDLSEESESDLSDEEEETELDSDEDVQFEAESDDDDELEEKLANYNWEEEDIEDIVDDLEAQDEEFEGMGKRKRKDHGGKGKKKRKNINIEYEDEPVRQRQYAK
jgi:protein MAK16